MSEKAFKKLLFSAICIMAIVTITGCDKDNSGTSENGGTGGSITSAGYVDLELPSGTKWKDVNETKRNDKYGFYTYDEAIAAFGDKLPTLEQVEELIVHCEKYAAFFGNKISGLNGKSIVLPPTGYRECDGFVHSSDDMYGYYWSSTPASSAEAYCYEVSPYKDISVCRFDRCLGFSVRLVKD